MVHSQHLCLWKSNHFLQIQNIIDFRLQPDKLCAFPKLHFCRILAYCDVENNIKFIIAPQHKLCSRYNVYFLLKLLKFRAVVLQQTTFFFSNSFIVTNLTSLCFCQIIHENRTQKCNVLLMCQIRFKKNDQKLFGGQLLCLLDSATFCFMYLL